VSQIRLQRHKDNETESIYFETLQDNINNNKIRGMQWPEDVSYSGCAKKKKTFFCSFAHVFFIRVVLDVFLHVCKVPDVIPVTFLLFSTLPVLLASSDLCSFCRIHRVRLPSTIKEIQREGDGWNM
jgi:hypothetical protein